MIILACDDFSTHSLEKLRMDLKAEIIRCKFLPSPEELKNADGILIRSRTKIDEKITEYAPKLKVVVSATAGFDHIDLELCEKRGINVFHTPESQSTSAAEHTMFLMLSLARKSAHSHQVMKRMDWKSEVPRGHLLRGKILGVVGLGRIGSQVTRLAQAFGMTVYAYDPYVSNEHFKKLGAERMAMSELMRLVDIVTLHVPLTPRTKTMVHAKVLDEMHPHAWVINTSRGGVVNEADLVLALQEKTIAAAALDVYQKEPLPKESPLRKLSNVILTPHIGAYTEEAFEHSSDEAIQTMIGFFQGNAVTGHKVDVSALTIRDYAKEGEV